MGYIQRPVEQQEGSSAAWWLKAASLEWVSPGIKSQLYYTTWDRLLHPYKPRFPHL